MNNIPENVERGLFHRLLKQLAEEYRQERSDSIVADFSSFVFENTTTHQREAFLIDVKSAYEVLLQNTQNTIVAAKKRGI